MRKLIIVLSCVLVCGCASTREEVKILKADTFIPEEYPESVFTDEMKVRQFSINKIYRALEVSLSVEKIDLESQMKKDQNAVSGWEYAEWIYDEAVSKDLDPLLIVAVSWKEARHNICAIGDSGRAIGSMQAQADWPGRPSREEMKADPKLAFATGTRILKAVKSSPKRYNGSKHKEKYQKSVLWMVKKLKKEV